MHDISIGRSSTSTFRLSQSRNQSSFRLSPRANSRFQPTSLPPLCPSRNAAEPECWACGQVRNSREARRGQHLQRRITACAIPHHAFAPARPEFYASSQTRCAAPGASLRPRAGATQASGNRPVVLRRVQAFQAQTGCQANIAVKGTRRDAAPLQYAGFGTHTGFAQHGRAARPLPLRWRSARDSI